MAGYKLSKDRPDVAHHDEWSSVSDIGRAHGGQVLTKEEYERVETLYLDAISDFVARSGIGGLRVTSLERASRDEIDAMIGSTGLVAGDALSTLCKQVLREAMWCRLRGPKRTYVHFGHDYIVYVGSHAVSNWSPPAGLYAVRMPSPYSRRR